MQRSLQTRVPCNHAQRFLHALRKKVLQRGRCVIILRKDMRKLALIKGLGSRYRKTSLSFPGLSGRPGGKGPGTTACACAKITPKRAYYSNLWRAVCFIDAYITVRMRISSVFLNMRIIIITCCCRLVYFTYIPRGDFSKMASNQALPGPSTSGFSNPSESLWEV